MIRLQNKVPDVYVNESRDFQLLLRLYDFVFNGTRFNILSTLNVLDPLHVNDKMLPLLATRVGFFPRIPIDSDLLRRIIASFPYIMKNKGNIKGIKLAVSTILKAENSNAHFRVINNTKDYVIEIYTEVELYNKNALIEVLSYVLPVGYDFKIGTYAELSEGKSTSQIVITTDKVNHQIFNSINISQVIGDDRVIDEKINRNDFDLANYESYNHLGDLGSMEIIGLNPIDNSKQTFNTTGEYDDDRLTNNRDTIDVTNPKENLDNEVL